MRPIRIVYITPEYPSGHSWEALWAGYLESNRYKEDGDEALYFNLFYDEKWEVVQAAYDADIVAITATSPQYKQARALKTEILDAWLSCQTQSTTAITKPFMVLGGAHASAMRGLANDGWDRTIAGEGEYPFSHIVNMVRKGYRQFSMPFPLEPFPADEWFYPDRHLIKQERHIQQAFNDEGRRVLSIFSGRGCSFKCDFCISHEIWGRRPRMRTAENVIGEWEEVIKDWRPDFIKFSDDTFTISRRRNQELYKLREERGINTEWGCNVHINTVKEQDMYDMYNAGCTEIWVGVESGSREVRTAMGKGHFTDMQIIAFFKEAKKVGLKTRAYWLIGHPKEDLHALLRSKDLAARLMADINGVTILCPFPGTEHYDHEQMKDWDWSQCDEYWNPYWKTEHFTNYQLKQHQKGLVRHFEELGELVIKHRRQLNEDSDSQ